MDLIFLVHKCPPSALRRSFAALSEAMGRGWDGNAILVENAPASPTSTAARALVRDCFPSARRTLLRSPRNLGFGSGINLGMAEAKARLVGVFNPDGAVEPEAVGMLVDSLDRAPRALMAGPTVLPFAAEAGSPAAEPAAEPPATPVDWLPAVAAVYRRSAFLDLGGFDPLYFMYSEDSELNQRARRSGYELLRVSNAVFRHQHDWRRWKSFNRMRLFVVSSTTWSYQHAPSRLAVLRLLARRRAGWLVELARRRRLAQLTGAIVGTASWPARIPRIERRRRHPWGRESLNGWLANASSRVERLPL